MPLNLRRPNLASPPAPAVPSSVEGAGSPPGPGGIGMPPGVAPPMGGMPQPPPGYAPMPAGYAAAAPPGYPAPAGYPPGMAPPAGYVPGYAPLPGAAPMDALGAAQAQAANAVVPKRFSYDWRVLTVARVLGYGLLLLGLWHLARTVLTAGQTIVQWHSYNDWKALIGAFVGVLLAFVMGALIVNAVPSFRPTGDGLVLRGFIRPLTIPWARIAQVRSMELPGERFVIFLEYNGAPLALEHQIYAMVAGLGRRPGVFLTSNLPQFEALVRLILRQRTAHTPPGLPGATTESLVDENAQMPLFQMLYDPQVTAVRVADLPAPDPDAPADDLRAVLSTLAERPRPLQRPLWLLQLGLATLPVITFWLDGLTRGFLPTQYTLLATFGLLALGVLELPLIALVTQALGENLYGQGLSNVAFGVYPTLELPRAAIFLPICALLALQGVLGGVISLLVTILWLGAAAWTAYLTTLFVMRLYQIDLQKAAMVGGASFGLQFVLALVYLLLR